ncbi:MAG: lipoprotein 17-related variable surface protein, partial [Mycoplasmoidaceae bacterium]
MKKKILISSLLIGSMVSILPLNFIFNNNIYKTKDLENQNNNEEQELSNISNLDTRDGYVDALYEKNYTTLFINNFTSPVVSPNPEIPGFLGVWDNNTIGDFPTAIGWTTHNLFLSWSANLIDHPSLEGQVPNGFKPGLVTAIHSDNKYSTDKKNQIFAIVANTANLPAREYWILRYNALDGTPIKDENSKMPIMAKSPLPQMNDENGNGSAFSLANDTINNRYIAFYPGKLVDFKNEIFGFQLNDDNEIEWLENKDHFQGHSSWKNNIDLSDDNIILGLAPFNTRRASIDNKASLALLVATSADVRNYNFKYINLQDDLSFNPNFESRALIGRTSGIFNSSKGIITVPKTLLPLAAIQRNINPNLQLFTFRNEEFQDTFKVQMVVPILKDNEWIYMYLSSIFDNVKNSYHISWKGEGSLSQGSFFSSRAFGSNPMPPNISWNENYNNEVIITHNSHLTDDRRFSGSQFIFDTIPPNAPWQATSSIIGSLYHESDKSPWRPRQIWTRDPYTEDNFIWSISNGETKKYVGTPGEEVRIWAQTGRGGKKHESFQSRASKFGWLTDQENAKLPSEITNAELETFGTGHENFFKIPLAENDFPGITEISEPKIKIFGEPIRDDSKGLLQGIFTLTQSVKFKNKTYNFESKIPFKVTGLNIKASPTIITQNNSILNNLPSDLTPENLKNFVNVIAAPEGATINNWSVTNQDNANGTATISVDVQPHFGDDSILSQSRKTITTNVSGLKKVSGTTAVRTSENDPDLTVWEVNSSNASRFVEIKDLIPGSSESDVKFEITNQKPLTGELSIVASIAPGAYYDPANKGLPSVAGQNDLKLTVEVKGFKQIPDTGTLVLPGTGPYPGVWPGFINEDNIMDFITIENQVPGSKASFSNFKVNPSTPNESLDGYLDFDIVFDKEYDTYGNIINGAKKTYRIKGLESSPTPLFTKIASTGNTDLFSNTLAPEINETNISQFIILVNLPSGVTPKYEFKNQKNTGQPKTGFLDVNVIVSKYLDEEGNIVPEEQNFPIRIEGLKTIPAATSVRTLQGDQNMLPELVSSFGIEKYLQINNSSPIPGRETSVEVNTDKLVSNNINGTISFEYKLINAVTDFGFIEESNYTPVTVSGFQKGTFTTVEKIADLKSEKASEFDLSKDNFFDFAKLAGYYIPLKPDDEGNMVGTTVEKVEKISFNDANGSATFKVSVKGGAINQQGNFTVDLVDINFTFDGFEIVS